MTGDWKRETGTEKGDRTGEEVGAGRGLERLEEGEADMCKDLEELGGPTWRGNTDSRYPNLSSDNG